MHQRHSFNLMFNEEKRQNYKGAELIPSPSKDSNSG
jgi:hypothetical protein